MAIKDFGKGLKSSLHDAVDTVKAKAKEVELPDIKEAGEKTSERIKSIFKKTDGDKPSNEAIAPTQNITSISARSGNQGYILPYGGRWRNLSRRRRKI